MHPDKDFTQLPEPVRLEETITSQDVTAQVEDDEAFRENAWMLRAAGGA